MEMKQLVFFSFLSFILILGQSSCVADRKEKIAASESNLYAKGFSIEKGIGFSTVIVNSPWDSTSVLVRYYLVKDPGQQVPSDGIKILIPLQSIAPTSSTHYEFLSLLGEIRSITALCNADMVYNPEIRAAVASGHIANLGDNFAINVEKLLAVSPDAVMVTGYEQNDKYSKLLEKSGIPVLYNQEWMENTLLGRAEWIKFIAAFYDKDELADSIFNAVEGQYKEITAKVSGVGKRPSILSGGDFMGTWNVPGGQSFMAQMYRDAGADYFYSSDSHTGSLSFTFESILTNFESADYWLSAPYYTFEELIGSDPRYQLLKACKNKQVYHFNKRRTPEGSSDYWEGAIAHPDILLADVIKILHPELLPDHELFYIEKLK
jgi:iron complex transport system substrate-binding protein